MAIAARRRRRGAAKMGDSVVGCKTYFSSLVQELVPDADWQYASFGVEGRSFRRSHRLGRKENWAMGDGAVDNGWTRLIGREGVPMLPVEFLSCRRSALAERTL
jgi:hypothetical protein